jgi:formate dehydrogenase assembly factor FdhD
MKRVDIKKQLPFGQNRVKKLKAKLEKDSATLRKHRATHWSKLQQQRSDDVVGMIMWVNKKGWRE